VDVNARARELTAANAATLELGNVRVAAPDEVDPSLCFAGIWSNPPIRIGKDALHGLLAGWLPRLGGPGGAPGPGEAWLVVQRHLGADSLAGWLGAAGWVVDRVASKQGYRVLRVRPAGVGGPA
jgi:16S rRNA G1207 methylase RsmC